MHAFSFKPLSINTLTLFLGLCGVCCKPAPQNPDGKTSSSPLPSNLGGGGSEKEKITKIAIAQINRTTGIKITLTGKNLKADSKTIELMGTTRLLMFTLEASVLTATWFNALSNKRAKDEVKATYTAEDGAKICSKTIALRGAIAQHTITLEQIGKKLSIVMEGENLEEPAAMTIKFGDGNPLACNCSWRKVITAAGELLVGDCGGIEPLNLHTNEQAIAIQKIGSGNQVVSLLKSKPLKIRSVGAAEPTVDTLKVQQNGNHLVVTVEGHCLPWPKQKNLLLGKAGLLAGLADLASTDITNSPCVRTRESGGKETMQWTCEHGLAREDHGTEFEVTYQLEGKEGKKEKFTYSALEKAVCPCIDSVKIEQADTHYQVSASLHQEVLDGAVALTIEGKNLDKVFTTGQGKNEVLCPPNTVAIKIKKEGIVSKDLPDVYLARGKWHEGKQGLCITFLAVSTGETKLAVDSKLEVELLNVR